MKFLKKGWSLFKSRWFLFGLLIFLYFPIIYVVIFSFSNGRSALNFGDFTLDNYVGVFENVAFTQAISTTLYVSIFSTFASVIFGVFGAYSLTKLSRWISSPIKEASVLPIVTPDLIIGLSLFIIFSAINIPLGTFTLIISHISFSAPYVMVVMYPRLRNMDQTLINASHDLGASKLQTFFKVTIPQMYGSVFSATVIAFIMSFDDFVISFFTSGSQNNISTFLFSLKRPSNIVNAFSTIFLFVLTGIIFSSSLVKRKRERRIIEKTKISLKKIKV